MMMMMQRHASSSSVDQLRSEYEAKAAGKHDDDLGVFERSV